MFPSFTTDGYSLQLLRTGCSLESDSRMRNNDLTGLREECVRRDVGTLQPQSFHPRAQVEDVAQTSKSARLGTRTQPARLDRPGIRAVWCIERAYYFQLAAGSALICEDLGSARALRRAKLCGFGNPRYGRLGSLRYEPLGDRPRWSGGYAGLVAMALV